MLVSGLQDSTAIYHTELGQQIAYLTLFVWVGFLVLLGGFALMYVQNVSRLQRDQTEKLGRLGKMLNTLPASVDVDIMLRQCRTMTEAEAMEYANTHGEAKQTAVAACCAVLCCCWLCRPKKKDRKEAFAQSAGGGDSGGGAFGDSPASSRGSSRRGSSRKVGIATTAEGGSGGGGRMQKSSGKAGAEDFWSASDGAVVDPYSTWPPPPGSSEELRSSGDKDQLGTYIACSRVFPFVCLLLNSPCLPSPHTTYCFY